MAWIPAYLRTPALDLNDQLTYFCWRFNAGDPVRRESVIEPWGNPTPTYARVAASRTQCRIGLHIRAGDRAGLVLALETVRNQFVDLPNSISWGLDASVARSFRTFQTAIPPVDLTDDDSHSGLKLAGGEYAILRWEFAVTRHPYNDGETREPVI